MHRGLGVMRGGELSPALPKEAAQQTESLALRPQPGPLLPPQGGLGLWITGCNHCNEW